MPHGRRYGVVALVVAIVFALGTSSAPPAWAGTLTVTTVADGPGPCTVDACTLRAAIAAANSAPGSTISFAPATNGTPVTVTSDLPAITANVTVAGNGAGSTVVSGGGAYRLLSVSTAATVIVRDLTLTAATTSGDGAGVRATGGASLTMETVRVTDSVAGTFGGGVSVGAGSTATITDSTIAGNTAPTGGGVRSAGTLAIASSTLTGNSAATLGGAMYLHTGGTTTLTDATVTANTAGEAAVAHLETDSTLRITFSTVTANNSTFPGSLEASFTGAGTLHTTGSILQSPDALCVLSAAVVNGGHNVHHEAPTTPPVTASCGLGTGSGNVDADALLAGLADNGGPTQTMRPGAGSPAIGHPMPRTQALAALPSGLDQRGVARTGDFWIGSLQDSPAVSVAPATADFGPVALGASSPAQVFTVSSVGTLPLTLGSITVAGTHAADFALDSGSCASVASLAVGGTCQVRVRFTPSAAGVRSATLVVSSPDLDPREVPLTGTGVGPPPDLTVDPGTIDFGFVAVGGELTRTVRLTSTGGAQARPGPMSVVGTGRSEYRLGASDCDPATPLAVTAECSVEVAFRPTTTVSSTATLVIASPDAGARTVALFGRGTHAAITLEPTSLRFPDRYPGDVAVASVLVTNTGLDMLHFADVSIAGPDQAAFRASVPDGVTSPVRPGEEREVRVVMSSSTASTLHASLVFTDNAPGGRHEVPLVGTVVPRPTIEAIVPGYGPTTGGTEVTITGGTFLPGVAVEFGGVPATSVTVDSAHAIRAVSPAHPAGVVSVTVAGPSGPTATFEYDADTTPSGGSLPPGTASAQVNGQPVPVTVAPNTSGTGVTLTGGGIGLSLSGVGVGGAPLSLGTGGTLVLSSGGSIAADGGGYQSGSTASLYLSAGTRAGSRTGANPAATTVVRSDGRFSLAAQVVREPGTATLLVTGVSAEGYPVEFALGVRVADRIAQRPTRPLRLPNRLNDVGLTRLVRVPVHTNAGEVARVNVACVVATRRAPTGDVLSCRLVRTSGWVAVRLTGGMRVIVRLHIHADAVPGYTAYHREVSYRVHATH